MRRQFTAWDVNPRNTPECMKVSREATAGSPRRVSLLFQLDLFTKGISSCSDLSSLPSLRDYWFRIRHFPGIDIPG